MQHPRRQVAVVVLMVVIAQLQGAPCMQNASLLASLRGSLAGWGMGEIGREGCSRMEK